jgi:hypothetical protein
MNQKSFNLLLKFLFSNCYYFIFKGLTDWQVRVKRQSSRAQETADELKQVQHAFLFSVQIFACLGNNNELF